LEPPLSYRRYGAYLRELFGTKVYKVSVDAGFTCPNIDGSVARGGCAYCNNASFRPVSVDRREGIAEQIRAGMATVGRRYGAKKFIVYFQNFTNTYGSLDYLRSIYETALSFDEVVGLSIGTRPDCLESPVIELLAELSQRALIWVEVGLESSHDATLATLNRGHDFACFESAVRRVAAVPELRVACHVIHGLPGESREQMLETIERVSALPIHGIKLHHLHVVKGTAYAELYRREAFPLLSLEEYSELLCESVARLREDIIIMRLFGVAPEDILIGPHWPMKKASIHHHLERALELAGIQQGMRAPSIKLS